MRAGRLRHRVSVRSRSQSQNSYGEPSNTFSEVTEGSVWASIEPISSAEENRSGGRDEIITHKVTMRYLASITSTHRVIFGSRVFDIVNVTNHEEKNERLELLCRERI